MDAYTYLGGLSYALYKNSRFSLKIGAEYMYDHHNPISENADAYAAHMLTFPITTQLQLSKHFDVFV